MASGGWSTVGGALVGGSAPVEYEAGASAGAVASNVRVLWDLDGDGDFDEPEEDITSYVMGAECWMGRDYPSHLSGRSGPGKLRLALRNDSDRFSFHNQASPLNQGAFSLRSGRSIRVETTDTPRGEASPSYVGIGAMVSADDDPVTVPLPTGLRAADPLTGRNADLVLVVASIRNAGTGTVNTPAGWVTLLSEDCVSVMARYYVEGMEGPTFSFSGGTAGATTMGQAFAVRDAHQQLSEVVAASATQSNASAQNIAVPGLTIPAEDCVTVVVGWKADDWTSVGALAGQFFTEISEASTTTGADAGHAIQYRVQTGTLNVVATNLVVTGGSAAVSRSLVFALRGAVDITDPVELASDRFDRPAASSVLGVAESGHTWTARTGGGFGVRGGWATAQTGPAEALSTYIVSTVDLGQVDHYVQAQIRMPVQRGVIGLVARYLDSSNYLRFYYSKISDGVGEWVLQAVVSGFPITLPSGGTNLTGAAWEGMTIGLGVRNQTVTAYVGGQPVAWGVDVIEVARPLTGTHAGLLGYWQSTSDDPPMFGGFQAWDRLGGPVPGVLWTGQAKAPVATVTPGPLKTAQVEAEGPLAIAAHATVPAPRIAREGGEFPGALSVRSGARGNEVVGDIMLRAGLGPPHPLLPAQPRGLLGAVGLDDAKALELARVVEVSDRGFLHETPEGHVTYEDTAYRSSRSPVAWFTDTLGRGQWTYSGIEPGGEAAEVVNRAIARVAPSAPIVTDVTIQSDDDGSAIDVVITMPTTVAGQLVLVFIACSADDDATDWGSPTPWVEHRTGMRGDQGVRVYSLVADGTEGGSSVTFYKGSVGGSFLAQIYQVDNWFGTDEGLDMGRVSQGTNAYPVTPQWGRAPTLYIVCQVAIGSTGGVLWAGLTEPPPLGYFHDTTNGLVYVITPEAYATGITSVYKIDCTDQEDPRDWLDVFDDYLLLETVCFAVRGYDGPIGKETLATPTASGGDLGEWVQVDDRASQLRHRSLRTNDEVPVLLYSGGYARQWCEAILDAHADDRPIIRMSFFPSKDAGLRRHAVERRVSDRVAVTTTGASGIGVEGQFHIEAITHSWSSGARLWRTTWELSPVLDGE